MNLTEAIIKLGLTPKTELLQVLQVEWQTSQQSTPAGGLPYLCPESVAPTCEAISLPRKLAQAALPVSKRIASNAGLNAIAWHYHHCLFRCTAYPWKNINRWPSLTEALREDTGMFYILVMLSGLPGMQAIYRAHSVPGEILRDTLSQLKSRITDYRGKHGNWGLNVQSLPWLMNHFHGKLYRLGRLQFQFGSFTHKLRAFRHRTSGTVVALSEGGVAYLADGQVNGEGRIYEATGAWTSQLIFTGEEIVGYPILPTGRVLGRKVRLSTAEWRQVLAPGDPILNIHIPGRSRMAYEPCGESFRAAVEFFPSHFPQKPFLSFCCRSWLLDSQLEQLLPPTSNLVRFQREVYLFPALSNDLHLLKVVFGCVPEDLNKAPGDTVLRRALLERLLGGGKLRASAGGCFLLPDDLNWGSQVYRRQTFPW